ncbi:MAG: hypothetical protein ACLQFR_02570 [Streptosporangiaceae bacterium]
MKPAPGAAAPDAGQARGWMPSRSTCLRLAAGWALLGASACAVTFAVSTIGAPTPDGRTIPLWLELAEGLLAASMLPACTLIPLPPLAAGRAHLRRVARAQRRWAAAWTAAASAGVALQALFWVRLVHFLGTSYADLPRPSWHALEFGTSFAMVGAAMIAVLIGATASPRTTSASIPHA